MSQTNSYFVLFGEGKKEKEKCITNDDGDVDYFDDEDDDDYDGDDEDDW